MCNLNIINMAYREKQCEHYKRLIEESDLFDGVKAKDNDHILAIPVTNLYKEIRDEAIKYFNVNKIKWWRGGAPSGNTLSSQVSCINHLMPIMKDKDAVLSLVNGIGNYEYTDVMPLACDADPQYIAFEVVSTKDHLNEGIPTRGANCTSIDAVILAKHKSGKNHLIMIEWKYTERYGNNDKSTEGKEGKTGKKRQDRYNSLISHSSQLKSMDKYEGSIYYYEPFYQLMRQTLWAEQVIAHKESEKIKAVDFLHVHVVPSDNKGLLNKKYKISGKEMEETWRGCLLDNRKYVIVDPLCLFSPIKENAKYKNLIVYLCNRYW